jgi:putative sugar O-methyltransferase
MKKNYSFIRKYRSESEDGRYVTSVMKAVGDPNIFRRFKSQKDYQLILEHVSKADGMSYLSILQDRSDNFLQKSLSSILIDDSLGSPIKYEYPGYNIALSPTTLRYIKVASDIFQYFGSGFNSVAEIGCGYGGQCIVNDELLDVKKTILFDLPPVNLLIEKYIESFLLNGSYTTKTLNTAPDRTYDLVVSNYAFSELPKPLQLIYVKKVLSRSSRGYLTMNSGRGGHWDQNKLSVDELREFLPDFRVIDEIPLTAERNYIIVWGEDHI